ncbi:MAG TPA: hypothetical protein VGD67_08950 [Pseudonocardiaceae bacterium]
MTAEPHHLYEDLHRLVDRLSTEQVDQARSFMLRLVGDRSGDRLGESAAEPVRRHLSFAGSISAEPDLATRSSEILEEIIRRNAG